VALGDACEERLDRVTQVAHRQQAGRHLTAFKQAVTRYTDTLLWIVNQRWMEFRLHQGASFFL
jgi:hypothetical protein